MNNKLMSSDALIFRLKSLDEEADLLFDRNKVRFDCYIVGGCAFVLNNMIPRMTMDIDVISTYPSGLAKLMTRYDMNLQVNGYMDNFEDGYESRAEKLNLDTRIIDYYVLSLEDLVISKIGSIRPKDYEDITNTNVIKNIDWNLLDNIYQSVYESKLDDLKQFAFKVAYEDYVEKYKRVK